MLILELIFIQWILRFLKIKKILLTVHSKLKIQEKYYLIKTVGKRKYDEWEKLGVIYEYKKEYRYNYILKEDIVLVRLYSYKGKLFKDDKFANNGILKISELKNDFHFDIDKSVNIVENIDDKKFYFTGHLTNGFSYYTFIACYFYEKVKGFVYKNFGNNSFLVYNPFFVKMGDEIGEKNPYRGYNNIPTSIAMKKDGKILILGYCYFDKEKAASFKALNSNKSDKYYIFLLRINP
jgi:hypothetical protein